MNASFLFFPSKIAFAILLRGRLTLYSQSLYKNPWIYGDKVSEPCLLLLMPAFSLPISSTHLSTHLYRPTERSTTVYFIAKYTCCFGINLKPRYIFSTKKLDQWAVTLSLKDGCFQAYLLVVLIFSLPFPLRFNLETLTNNQGCFPLELEP